MTDLAGDEILREAGPALATCLEAPCGGSDVPPTALPVRVHAQVPFTLINLWTLPHPSSEAYALTALAACGPSYPTIVIGDFNSTPALASQRISYTRMVRHLRDEFGLVSADHAHHGVEHGRETHPTYFDRRQEGSQFHIDYCFVPEGLGREHPRHSASGKRRAVPIHRPRRPCRKRSSK